MDDNVVDSLRIEVVGDSSKAIGGIDKLISTLEKIKGVTNSSNKGLNAIQKNLNKISEAVKKIDSGSVTKLRELTEGLKGLNEIKLSGKAADRIVDLGAAVDLLKDVDFTKLTELANGLQALKDVGNVKIPRLDSPSAPTPDASPSPAFDERPFVLPSVIEDTNTALNDLSADMNENRYLWAEIETGGIRAFQRIKAALDPVNAKIKSVVAKGTVAVAKFFTNIANKPLSILKKAAGNATAKIANLFMMFKKRAMYRAINAIISAITTGFKEGTANVYQYSKALGDTLASSLDRIATSSLYFKNSVGAAAAPLINELAPAIDYITDKCVNLLNALNQVFAKLSGASTWTKAIKYPTEYAEAAESATAANKDLKKTILGIDEINPLAANSSSRGGSSGSGMDYSKMFEEVETAEINNPFKDFFKPFADAWANEGQNTIKSIKNALSGIKGFVSTVGDSFRKIWENGTGQQTLETIFGIFQSIFDCVGNLGTSLETAWKTNDNGTKILQNIWNIFNDLLGFVERINGATADWLASLNLTPLMTAFEGCTAALEPLVNLIGDRLAWCYENVLLPLASWVIEDAAPAALDLLSTAIETLANIVSVLQPSGEWLWNNFLQPLGEWAGEIFIEALGRINDLLSKFNEFLEGNITFREFLDNLSLGENLLLVFATAIGVVTAAVTVWNTIGAIATAVTTAFGAAVAVLTSPVTLVVAAIATLVAAGIALYQNWDKVKEKLSKILSGIKNFFSDTVEKTKLILLDLKNGFKEIFDGIWGVVKGVINSILGGIEGMANGVIKGLNFMINALNKFSFDVPDWVTKLTGIEKFGFNIKNISEVSIPRLADGGMVNAGTMFIAGEAGAEVVANIGNRTGVMNTDEMRESVAQGVADANAEQTALLREQNRYLKALLEKDQSHNTGASRDILSQIERKNRRDGKTVIPLGI